MLEQIAALIQSPAGAGVSVALVTLLLAEVGREWRERRTLLRDRQLRRDALALSLRAELREVLHALEAVAKPFLGVLDANREWLPGESFSPRTIYEASAANLSDLEDPELSQLVIRTYQAAAKYDTSMRNHLRQQEQETMQRVVRHGFIVGGGSVRLSRLGVVDLLSEALFAGSEADRRFARTYGDADPLPQASDLAGRLAHHAERIRMEFDNSRLRAEAATNKTDAT